MPQIKEHVSNEFNKIELKIHEINFLQNLEFKLEFFVKIQEIYFLWIFIWYLSRDHVKYLDKRMKCQQMRANIKSK